MKRLLPLSGLLAGLLIAAAGSAQTTAPAAPAAPLATPASAASAPSPALSSLLADAPQLAAPEVTQFERTSDQDTDVDQRSVVQ